MTAFDRSRSVSWIRFAIGLLLAFAVAVAAPRSVRAQESGIEIGQKGPSALVETLDGKPVDLATLTASGPVLLEFWATWCPNCKELEPQLKKVAAKYGKQVRFVAVAVSVNESPERVKRFVAQRALPGQHFYDRKGKATAAYDVPATSYVVVLDRSGKVVYTGLGGDQNLEQAIKKAL